MRCLVPLRTIFLLLERRPSISSIQHIKLLKSAIAPLSSASHSNGQRSSITVEELRALNGDLQEHLSAVHEKELTAWKKRFDELIKERREEAKEWREEAKEWREEAKEWREEAKESARQIAKLESVAMSTLDEKLRIEKRFNIRGALERIAFSATIQNIVPLQGGVQEKLNALATTVDFQNILNVVVANRKLVLKDVKSCVNKLYHETSKHAHGNLEPIVIPEGDFVPAEVAALEAFMKLQDTWAHALVWKVERK